MGVILPYIHWICFYISTGYIVTQTTIQGNKRMSPSRLLPQLNLRFSSQELKNWVAEQAKVNHRTLTAEINYHIEKAMMKKEEQKD